MKHKMKVASKKAKGGKVDFYAGGNSPTGKEALEKKNGGAVKKKSAKMEGCEAPKRADKRARGGRTGSDKHPFSSAHNTSPAKGHSTPDGASVNSEDD
jgi:hypothetical protein